MADAETSSACGADGMRCYLSGILFPIIFLTTAPYKTNRFLRFHSFQSIVFTLAWVAVIYSPRALREQTATIPFSIVCIVFFFTWVLLMVKARQGKMFKLPLIGLLASRWAG
jgi:uncharacterized membrane protein